MEINDAFSHIDFAAERFIQNHGGTEPKKLQQLRSKIQSDQQESADQMKRNVIKNYSQFIETSNDIQFIQSEMTNLNTLLSDQKKVIERLQNIPFTTMNSKQADGNPTTKPLIASKLSTEDRQRSMQQLLEKVEGSVRLSENPNRYVVFESDLVELNPDTMAQMKQIRMFLLNDSILISSFVAHRLGPMRYRFEEVYQVEHLAAVSVPESARVKDTFKMLIFPHQKFFQAENAKLKRRWLDQIDHVKRQLMSESSLVRQATLRNRMSQRQETLEHDFSKLSNPLHGNNGSGTSVDEDCLKELPEEVDICIAERDFAVAVDILIEAREILSGDRTMDSVLAQDLKEKFAERERYLSDVLCKELSSLHGGPKAARVLIKPLITLGKASQACELYLKHKSQVLKLSVRELKILDAPLNYVQQLNRLVFGTLEEVAIDCNTKLFSKSPDCIAVLVVWASGELRNYVVQLVRHVFEASPSLSIIATCISMARNKADNLDKIGLGLRFELEKLLDEHIVKVVSDVQENVIEAIRRRIHENSWRPSNFQNEINLIRFLDEMSDIGLPMDNYVTERCKLWLTEQVCHFSRLCVTFMDDVKLLDPQNWEQQSLIDNALSRMWNMELSHLEKEQINAKQSVQSLMSRNIEFLVEFVLPRCPDYLRSDLTKRYSNLLKSNFENIGDV